MDRVPGIANPQLGREEGRPELAIRVDRPKAALLGLSVSGVANTIRTNISGTQAAMFRERGKEFPIIVRLREEDRDRVEDGQRRPASARRRARCCQAKNLLDLRNQAGPTQIRAQEPAAHHARQRRARADVTLGEAVKACRPACPR